MAKTYGEGATLADLSVAAGKRPSPAKYDARRTLDTIREEVPRQSHA